MALTHEFSGSQHTWIIDSGASSHMTPHRDNLDDYVEFRDPRPIILGDGRRVDAHGSGKVEFSNFKSGTLSDVLWVPDLKENLFSIGKAMEKNCDVKFSNRSSKVTFLINNAPILKGYKMPGQRYSVLDLEQFEHDELSNHSEMAFYGATEEEWHKRLGHCSIDTVRKMIKEKAAAGLKITSPNSHECQACIMEKSVGLITEQQEESEPAKKLQY